MRELNLLPIEIKDVHKKRRSRILGAMTFFGVVAIAAIAMIIPKIIIFTLENKESNLKEQVAIKQYIADDNLKLNNKIKDFKGYFSLIESIRANDEKVTFKLKEVSEQLPPEVAITSLTLNGQSIVIVANSKDYTAMCNFTANLQLCKKYKKVYLAGITAENGATPKYTSTITLVK